MNGYRSNSMDVDHSSNDADPNTSSQQMPSNASYYYQNNTNIAPPAGYNTYPYSNIANNNINNNGYGMPPQGQHPVQGQFHGQGQPTTVFSSYQYSQNNGNPAQYGGYPSAFDNPVHHPNPAHISQAPSMPPIMLDHDPTLAFALTLFEDDTDMDGVDDDEDDTSHTAEMTDSSGDNITNHNRPAAGVLTAGTTNKTTAAPKNPKHTTTSGGATTSATSNSMNSAGIPALYNAHNIQCPKAQIDAHIRGLLEARAREIIAMNTSEALADAAVHAATSQRVSSTKHGHDALQYFGVMMGAFNGGSYSDLCNYVDRFFSPDCSYKRIVIGVRRSFVVIVFHLITTALFRVTNHYQITRTWRHGASRVSRTYTEALWRHSRTDCGRPSLVRWPP
jgi:hypothetical protein